MSVTAAERLPPAESPATASLDASPPRDAMLAAAHTVAA